MTPPVMSLDLRVHLGDSEGRPICGDFDPLDVVSRMVTAHGPAVTCAACLVAASDASLFRN